MRREIDLLREQLAKSEGREEKVLKLLEEQIIGMRALTDQREEKKAEKGRGVWSRLFG
jgi:hypothetical protein